VRAMTVKWAGPFGASDEPLRPWTVGFYIGLAFRSGADHGRVGDQEGWGLGRRPRQRAHRRAPEVVGVSQRAYARRCLPLQSIKHVAVVRSSRVEHHGPKIRTVNTSS